MDPPPDEVIKDEEEEENEEAVNLHTVKYNYINSSAEKTETMQDF